MHCSLEEMAAILQCHPDTLTNRFSAEILMWKSERKEKLRKKMWQQVEKGNFEAMKWLSKQHLGMAEKVETDNKNQQIGDFNLRWEDEETDGDTSDAKTDASPETDSRE